MAGRSTENVISRMTEKRTWPKKKAEKRYQQKHKLKEAKMSTN